MTSVPTPERRSIRVEGADDVIEAFRARLAEGMPSGVAAARSLIDHHVDWWSIRSEILASERSIILADAPDGPVVAARCFRPDAPTTIHDHGGAGAALVVEGRDRYERFRRIDGSTARLDSVHDLGESDVMWWNEPPRDLHRQCGLEGGAIELLLVERQAAQVTVYLDATAAPSPLKSSLVTGWLDGDVSALMPWYHDEVIADLNVPEWRFQVRGRQQLLQQMHDEEFARPHRRVTYLRATDTAEGVLLETESRFGLGDELRVCREAHHLVVQGGLIVEHVVWCTGTADAKAAWTQFSTAPLELA